ncbi:MAG: Hpt domain-containing protein, partial [Burkholderiales bacterium]|nr:Hpt domain-containing protein [Burkholderiales bacterium]
MVTDVHPEFDIGPLSWVQGEIDQSLTHALESLNAFDPALRDASPLQRARTHFRQAAGAIHMVGLDSLQAYTDEIERQLERLGSGVSKQEVSTATPLITRACRKMQNFLAELVQGVPMAPLTLFAEYEGLQRLRGVKTSHPADLFYPDMSARRDDDDDPRQAIPPEQFPSFLVRERRRYERGLLAWLRGDIKGANTMREAAENIEIVTPQQTVRTFWWTATALFDAVREEAVANTFFLKHLLARIDLQIRRLIDDGGSVAERLQRETLYFLAVSAPASERICKVQEHYRLKALLPPEEAGSGAVADTMATLRATREAQALTAEVKNLWQRLMGGQTDQHAKFRDGLQTLCDKTAASAYPEMQPLFISLFRGSSKLTLSNVPETVAMEYATALLFAEDVFTQQGAPVSGIADNVRIIRARLEAALTNRPLPALDVPALAALSERAQNRMLLAQVAQDIQANLRHMEQELDAFFRDNSKRAGLQELAKDGREISGALRILGLDDADHLLAACMAQINRYAAPEGASKAAPDRKDFELLAESLSALGFYIEAIEQQRPQREELILPLLARQQERARERSPQLGEKKAAADAGAAPRQQQPAPEKEKTSVKESKAEPAPTPLSIEATIDKNISRLQSLGQQLQQHPQESALRRDIEKIVQTLGDDAKLVGNASLSDKIKLIRERINAGAFFEIPTLLAGLTETAVAPPLPSAETRRLLQVDASQLDAELLDIYLQEAIEVLDGVREHRAQLAQHPHDHEALRTVRRAFHTLKGSGRMVGLTDLGELAYDVEKIHNRLLEKGYPATPVVLAMIDVAEREFRQWVEALIKSKTVSPDSAVLYAAIDEVAREFDSETLLTPPSDKVAQETAQKKTLPSAFDAVATVAKAKPAEVPKVKAPEEEKPEAKEPEEEKPEAKEPEKEKSKAEEPAVETNWDKWELSPPLSETSAAEKTQAPVSHVAPIAAEKPVEKIVTLVMPIVQCDDSSGEISLEIDMASLRKIPAGAPHAKKKVTAVENPDGSVSLDIAASPVASTPIVLAPIAAEHPV